MSGKPDIVGIISEHMDLSRVGRRLRGLCPLHEERTPSFYVDEVRQRYKCFGCGEHGDVIDFVIKRNRLTFMQAKAALGMNAERPRRPPLTPRRKRAAEIAATWVNNQRDKFNVMIADALERRNFADEIGDFKLAESFDRELIIFRGFYDALKHPRSAVELLAMRESIAQITEGADVAL